ncbi:hypothetical protein [Paenibacillus glycanilyticus]|uniref:Oxidoreductase n=1 Tax=Paenibacillus glycanilyticus TaxID=126569 RepID=A0ABQ6GCP9_9BACL|nr:hypothetical protein [Paenibacillus glycanilyticus]GLX68018.1 hypothetical protein MU1_23630 [Paenibacillus glycanilyticus]
MKKSKFEIQLRLREGYPGPIHFADFKIDGQSLYDRYVKEFDFVSCLGWGSEKFQQEHIGRLILQGKPDFENGKNSIYICPACADLGCGAVSVIIEMDDDIVTWSCLEGGGELLDSRKQFHFDKESYVEQITSTLGLGGFGFPWTN